MVQKKDFVFGAILIYLILILMIFVLEEKKSFEYPCQYNKPCVRFCCSDSSACKEKYIRENFNASLLNHHRNEAIYNETEEFKILIGKPMCSLRTITVNDSDEWNFDSDGEVYIDGRYYNVDSYCLEESIATNEDFSWTLHVCNKTSKLQKYLHFTQMIIADLFMAATVFAYAYVKGLRTVPGRIFLFLSISMLTVYIFYPLIVFHFMSTILEYFIVFMLLSGFLNSFLWMSVISFDIWWTFRYFHVTSDGTSRLKCYYASVLSIWFLMILLTFFVTQTIFVANILAFVFIGFLAIAACDIIFFIHTATTIFRMRNKPNIPDQSRFNEEKKRFWMYLQLYIIVIVTWPLEMFPVVSSTSVGSLICDIVKCFAAVSIFCIFVLKKGIRMELLESYDALKDPSDQLIPESP